jgi:hypothetical protein
MSIRPPSDREAQVDALFLRALPVISEALTIDYGLSEDEAAELEQNLYLWFDRLARRPGQVPLTSLRSSLLLAACQFARGVCQMKREAAEATNPGSARLLRHEPAAFAVELERRLMDREREPR